MRHGLAMTLILGTAIVGSSWPQAASAQQAACGPRDTVLGKLQNVYSEERTAVAITASGELMELLTSPSGTWTILVTVPAGITCMVANGDGWKTLNAPHEEPLAESSNMQPQELYSGGT